MRRGTVRAALCRQAAWAAERVRAREIDDGGLSLVAVSEVTQRQYRQLAGRKLRQRPQQEAPVSQGSRVIMTWRTYGSGKPVLAIRRHRR